MAERHGKPCITKCIAWQHDITVTLAYVIIHRMSLNAVSSRGDPHANSIVFCWVTVTGHCFTNVSRALKNILSKFVYCRNRTSYENSKLKLCTRAQSYALGTRTKFRLEILSLNEILGIVYFREIILESLRNVSETTPWLTSDVPQCI